jgi:glycine betaine/proline transport system ATP-binding protein
MSAAVEFDKVDILFPSKQISGRKRDASVKAALEQLDAGKNRTEIESATGVVVGVSNASLRVEQGQISVLMGLSGSGKSTLLRAANGLNRVTRGRVMVYDGKQPVDVAACGSSTLRSLRRNTIAMIFQQFGLLPWRTVRENVGLGLELRGESAEARKRIVDEKLELVGLERWADRYGHELSGGMQQRVGLARAFATDAAILLMDEPFSALDPLIRTKLQDELLALQARVRKTILFVTHDLDEALKLGNQTSVLEGGRIVQTGKTEDIVLRPADAYVGEFVQHMNPLSVLNGRMVMRQIADLPADGSLRWLDPARQYAVTLDADGRAVAASLDGKPLVLRAAGEEGGIRVADVETPLRQLIQWCKAGHPVLLEDGGVIRGVCGPTEVLRALATSDARSRAFS